MLIRFQLDKYAKGIAAPFTGLFNSQVGKLYFDNVDNASEQIQCIMHNGINPVMLIFVVMATFFLFFIAQNLLISTSFLEQFNKKCTTQFFLSIKKIAN